jgi:ABC-type transporter Mla MlaB component
MLRITVHREPDSIELQLEGRLAGDWVHELRSVWNEVASSARRETVTVTLTDVSGVDTAGRRLLQEIVSAGVVLAGAGLFARALIDEITGIPS